MRGAEAFKLLFAWGNCGMRIRQVAASFVLVVVAFPSAGQGQTVQEPEARKLAERNALRLLHEVIGEAAQLNEENRLLVQARSADILWPHDEQGARALFKEASDGFAAMTSAGDADGTQEESRAGAYAAMRQDLLAMMARHDAHLALDFLRATRRAGSPEAETQLRFTLATQIASSEPALAAQLAEQSMRVGFPPQLTDLLARLQRADPSAASRMVEVVLARLRVENLAANAEAADVARELLSLDALTGTGSPRGRAATPLVNQQAMRELVSMFSAAALQSPSNDDQTLLVLQSVLPQVDTYAPALAGRVRRRVAELARRAKEGDGEADGGAGAQARGVEPSEAGRALTNTGRVERLISEAMRRAEAGQKRPALDALDEARGLLGDNARTVTQLNARLQLVRAYAPLDAGRALELLESVVDQLNELADAAAVVDGFLTDEQLTRDGQLRLRMLSGSLGQMMNVEAVDFAPLACADFARTKGVADSFRRPELRVVAHLLLAQSVLVVQAPEPAAERRQSAASAEGAR
jgi:hypothetical protein